jgi:hypothetical protein
MEGFYRIFRFRGFRKVVKRKAVHKCFYGWMEGVMGSLPDMEEKRKIGVGMEIEMNQGQYGKKRTEKVTRAA